MNTSPLRDSLTYPHGFLDFLTLTPKRGHRLGDYELPPAGLEKFNAALRALSEEAPSLTLDQFATAAQRALDRYPDGQEPAFVTSRMLALTRLEALVADPGWEADDLLRSHLRTVQAYIAASDDLIPDGLPVVGRLDDAVLIDVALQLLRDDLAEYEDYCRFRQIAADFADIPIAETGLTRGQWLEALQQARGSQAQRYGRARVRYVPDPRATLFYIS
jgi:hypothetical protein